VLTLFCTDYIELLRQLNGNGDGIGDTANTTTIDNTSLNGKYMLILLVLNSDTI